MIGAIKSALKKPFIRKEHKRYKEEMDAQFVSYNQWVCDKYRSNYMVQDQPVSTVTNTSMTSPLVTIIPYETCEKELNETIKLSTFTDENGTSGKESCTDVFLFMSTHEHMDTLNLSSKSLSFEKMVTECKLYVQQYFLEHPEAMIVYGDEDEWNSLETKVLNPWFKPNWSPDTLESFFYFGSVVAIRRSLLLSINLHTISSGVDWKSYMYRLVWEATKLCQAEEIHHVNQILYHSHGISAFGRDINVTTPIDNTSQQGELVSIVIPSKDNVEVLRTCIISIYQHTQIAFEIIVVDNGSTVENQKRILDLQEEYGFQYVYEKCEFNFSSMCNKGADIAKGKYILFLNDDIEVIQHNWLSLMVEKASKKHVGAVGVKLLYPDSDKIQHVGISNLRLGPVHKLQFHSDELCYEFYRNRVPYNVLAVTGACLMVRKEVFIEVGGFLEELAVAFNDVELCFRIHKLGYFNVNRNDVTLYHHESLSRGNDASKEKLARLQREKKKLYTIHPDLYGKDPYYSEGYTNDILDTNFSYRYQYAYEKVMEKKTVSLLKTNLLSEWENRCLQISLEYAGSLALWEHGILTVKSKVDDRGIMENNEENTIFFQGYSFVIGSDNSLYDRSLLLKKIHCNQTVVYEVSLNQIYRPDIEVGLGDQINCGLCGFAVTTSLDGLEYGEYQVGILAKARRSRQRLLQWTNQYVVKGEGC